MRTRHLVFALLLIVAAFVTRGYYVMLDVRDSTAHSHEEFGVTANVINPLIDTYEYTIMENQVKASHYQVPIKDLDALYESTQAKQKILLKEYADVVNGHETTDDIELAIRAKDVDIYIDKIQTISRSGDVVVLHRSLETGEMYNTLDPIIKCLHKISETRLAAAEKYNNHVIAALSNFHRLVIAGVSLVVILTILAIRYKEPKPIHRKRNFKFKSRSKK